MIYIRCGSQPDRLNPIYVWCEKRNTNWNIVLDIKTIKLNHLVVAVLFGRQDRIYYEYLVLATKCGKFYFCYQDDRQMWIKWALVPTAIKYDDCAAEILFIEILRIFFIYGGYWSGGNRTAHITIIMLDTQLHRGITQFIPENTSINILLVFKKLCHVWKASLCNIAQLFLTGYRNLKPCIYLANLFSATELALFTLFSNIEMLVHGRAQIVWQAFDAQRLYPCICILDVKWSTHF